MFLASEVAKIAGAMFGKVCLTLARLVVLNSLYTYIQNLHIYVYLPQNLGEDDLVC